MSRRRWMFAVLIVSLFSVAPGCASKRSLDISRRLTSLDMVAKKPPDALYVVDPPDVIQIEWLSQAGMTRSVTLRSDGRVTLPLLGDVLVAQMTTEQIQGLLIELYSKYYREPRLFVSVVGYNSKHIYVYGEVGGQGDVPYRGYTTVADVIGQVGGVTRRAATGRVRVIRGDPDEPEIFKVDLDALIYDGDALQNVSLAENDVVYVPPTVLAWVGYQIDQLLFPFRSILGAIFTVETATNVGSNDRSN